MRHDSVMMETPCEFINVVPVNPLISKCQIKVCYVGDEPNRNRSVITKEVARDLANSLPGSPIVGYFNEETNDFEEHSRDVKITNNGIEIVDITRPYGFVDLNAKCWFQKFLDDGKNEHEYLMTEGYLWTGQYPESQRIIDSGNNQSMELHDKLIDAQWTKDINGKPQFFIINKAIISKLCVLGEELEPCFEGSTITSFSLNTKKFLENIDSMKQELLDILENVQKGGTQVFTTYAVKVGDALWTDLYSAVNENSNIVRICEDEGQKYAVLQSKEDDKKFSRLNFSYSEEEGFVAGDESDIEFMDMELQFSAEEIETFENEFKKKEEDEKEKKEEEDKDDKSKSSNSEDKTEEDSEEKPEDKKDSEEKDDKKPPFEKEEDKDDEDKKKKNKYSLEEIPEYVELASQFSKLTADYEKLVAEKESLESQLQPLQQFKMNAERVAKEDMINNTFYMLSDEDKADVMNNIDNYSLDEIEAKLSVICVRNKVSFSALEEEGSKDPTTYNLNGNLFQDDSTPAWVKAVMDTAKTLNN